MLHEHDQLLEHPGLVVENVLLCRYHLLETFVHFLLAHLKLFNNNSNQ